MDFPFFSIQFYNTLKHELQANQYVVLVLCSLTLRVWFILHWHISERTKSFRPGTWTVLRTTLWVLHTLAYMRWDGSRSSTSYLSSRAEPPSRAIWEWNKICFRYFQLPYFLSHSSLMKRRPLQIISLIFPASFPRNLWCRISSWYGFPFLSIKTTDSPLNVAAFPRIIILWSYLPFFAVYGGALLPFPEFFLGSHNFVLFRRVLFLAMVAEML